MWTCEQPVDSLSLEVIAECHTESVDGERGTKKASPQLTVGLGLPVSVSLSNRRPEETPAPAPASSSSSSSSSMARRERRAKSEERRAKSEDLPTHHATHISHLKSQSEEREGDVDR